MAKASTPPVALTIAGFDPSGGAGVLADVRTFAAFGCFPTAAITSLTFQNTVAVFGAVHQTAIEVRSQVVPVLDDFQVACVKTGMLPSVEVINEVARLFHETNLPAPVVDPVIRSTSGYDLIDDEALRALIEKLFPLSCVITPNIPEAERITGRIINDEEDMLNAAAALCALGASAVLLKGGHGWEKAEGGPQKDAEKRLFDGPDFDRNQASDLLYFADKRVEWFRGPRIRTRSTHGTGCTLSAAIAACLGLGFSLEDAAGKAKQFVTEAIRSAPGLGEGHGPLNLNVQAPVGKTRGS
jgi:hydroxymethylpyrimidine/phosphomethylpyrimidine kinase